MTQRIGVRELRENFSLFLESSEAIEVTRYGQTIGFFIPIPKRPGQAQREALLEAGKRMDDELIRLGLKEDDLLEEFRQWRQQHKRLVIDANILIRAVLGYQVRHLISSIIAIPLLFIWLKRMLMKQNFISQKSWRLSAT